MGRFQVFFLFFFRDILGQNVVGRRVLFCNFYRKIGEIHCQVQGQHSKVNCKMLMVHLEAGRRIGECFEVEEIDQEVDLEREQEQMELCRSLDFPRLL